MIRDKNLSLRRTTEDDLPFAMRAERHPENSAYVLQWSREMHEALLTDSDAMSLIIESSNAPIGFVILRGFASERGPIELKRIVVTSKGHGYGRRALQMIKVLVFDNLARHRLWLNVFPENQTAKRLYLSEGFRYEGTWRDHHPTDSGFRSMELMAMLATDQPRPQDRFEIAGTRYQLVRSLSRPQMKKLHAMFENEWPSGSRTLEDIALIATGSTLVIAVVDDEAELVGFCRVVSDRGYRGWISGLVIDERHRGRGLGRRIIEEVLAAPEVCHVVSVGLSCHEQNISLYEKFGFVKRDGESVMILDLNNGEQTESVG